MDQEEYLLNIDENFYYKTFLSNFEYKILEILQNKSEITKVLMEREKIVRKHVLFNGHVLAVGSFTSSPFRSGVPFIPLRFILYTILHYIPPTFISPRTKPSAALKSSGRQRPAMCRW